MIFLQTACLAGEGVWVWIGHGGREERKGRINCNDHRGTQPSIPLFPNQEKKICILFQQMGGLWGEETCSCFSLAELRLHIATDCCMITWGRGGCWGGVHPEGKCTLVTCLQTCFLHSPFTFLSV